MIFDIGCLCHLAHLCVGRGAKDRLTDTIAFAGVQNEKTC